MLIYRLLGENAQASFARSWGVSYGLNAATEWKDIFMEAAKGAIVLAIMERLFLTDASGWLEEHIDFLSLQALLFKKQSVSFAGRVRTLFTFTKRLSAE